MLFANNCNTTLNGGITAVATSMVVTSATGFPAPTGSQYFYCTLADAATQTTIEIVKVTSVSGTTFTIVRGQDGTTGTIFASGAVVSLRLVRANLNDFPKLDEDNTFTFAPTFNTALAVGSGGTGLTTLTAGYIPYGNGTSAFASSANLYFNGTKLGIGTSSPSYDFTVSSTAQVAGGFTGSNVNGMVVRFASTSTNGHDYGIGSNFVTATGELAIYDYTAGATRVYIGGTGGVSIGNTTDPGAGNLSVTGYTSSASFRPTSSTVPTNGLYLPAANNLGFAINSAEAMRLNNFNQLLLGTTLSTDVSTGLQNIHWNGTNFDGLNLHNVNTSGNAQYSIVFNRNGNTVGSVQTFAAATAYVTTSDYRLKENIAPMIGALAKVAQLKPVTYSWKLDGSNAEGFIAHELAQVCPQAVTGTKDETKIVEVKDDAGKVIETKEVPVYQGIDTSFLVATLTAAIQELNDKFDAYVASHP